MKINVEFEFNEKDIALIAKFLKRESKSQMNLFKKEFREAVIDYLENMASSGGLTPLENAIISYVKNTLKLVFCIFRQTSLNTFRNRNSLNSC